MQITALAVYLFPYTASSCGIETCLYFTKADLYTALQLVSVLCICCGLQQCHIQIMVPLICPHKVVHLLLSHVTKY